MGDVYVSAGSPLEQFVILAKSARGAAARDLVLQALGAPGVFVFGELIASPNIQELAKSVEMNNIWELLNIFAYGTFEEFLQNRERLPPLTEPMSLKLRQLTLVTLAEKDRRIPYPVLQNVLHVGNVRELEDLIIDATYKGIIKGKLDQQNQCLEVEQCRGRDVKPEKLPRLLATLSQWGDRCQAVLSDLEEQIRQTDKRKQHAVQERKRIEDEYNNLKKTLRVAGGASSATPDIDENIPGEVTSTRAQEPERKKEKTRHKGLRGSSARVFSKN